MAAEFAKADDRYDIYGISDLVVDTPAKLTYGYMLPSGKIELTTVDVTIPANESTVIASLAKEGLPEDAIPVLELEVEGAPLFRRRFIEKEHKIIGLEKSDIKVTLNGDGTATYLSDKLVLGVCLDLDGDDGELSDNFFDLYPGRPYTVKLGSKSGEVLYSYT